MAGIIIVGMPPPKYDSGWTNIAAGELKTFTHNLGGDENNYLVIVDARSDTYKINQINFGTRQLPYGVAGFRWESLDNTQLKVWRFTQDVAAEQVRVRIWTY